MMKKKSVDLRLLYDILRGLKALCAHLSFYSAFTKESLRDIKSKKLMSFSRKYLWVKW